MKVVLPDPAMPTQTMATGGLSWVVEDAMMEGLVEVLIGASVAVGNRIYWQIVLVSRTRLSPDKI